MPSLPLPRAILDYELSESGADPASPLVVQLHGLTSSRARDAELGLDLVAGLTGHRVARYDARGHGASTGDPDPASYQWGALAQDLMSLLDVLAPGQAVHGVGQSMGAGTLLHAAVAAPQRFESLVLGIPPTAWSTRAAQRRTYLSHAQAVEREGVEALLAQEASSPTPPAVDADRPRARPTVTAELLPAVFAGAAATDLPAPHRLAALAMPTLLLAWVDDPAHPLSTAQRLHELMPHSRLVVARTPADTHTWTALVADHVERTSELVR
ncbi:MAG TPA: alpha/beta fold hydrolase [Ornithinimicrobium sp.]|uniref:alpha/beta fold hydrolase n=1 Tax=Ornithinimicrobium sp. TaxID=1977084 RepID=UPI002B46E148|nr:alpha/beta fold hydrolase [Ornithinimicrobium sp.]HKJ12202.1 alpha/beta fold hydrolase [Ornithinimicrobium sp.]